MTQTAGESLRTHTHTPRCTQVECQRSPAERMPHNSSTQFSAVNPPPTRPRTHTAKPPSADRNEEHNEMCVNRRRGSPPRRSHGKSTSAVCSKPELWTTSGVCVCVCRCVSQVRSNAIKGQLQPRPRLVLGQQTMTCIHLQHTHTLNESVRRRRHKDSAPFICIHIGATQMLVCRRRPASVTPPPPTSPPPPSPDHQGHAALCFFLRVMQARSKAVCSIK